MLGIIDWGIGGIDFYRRLRARHSAYPIIYFSDTGSTPYGKLSRTALLSRLEAVIVSLEQRGVTHVVVACNAASTVLPLLRPSIRSPLPIEGVIEHGIRAARATAAKTIAVIGGLRTIRSGIYRRALASEERIVIQRVAQPLSAFIERGDLDSPALHRAIAHVVGPLRQARQAGQARQARRVDALVLACTHYRAIAPLLADALPGVILVDPVTELLRVLPQQWTLPSGHSPSSLFLTTGDPEAMARSAKLAFDVTLSAQRVAE